MSKRNRQPGTLPNLLIGGVPKAGTSSLFRYLAQHPDVCPSTVKEIAFFNPLREEGGTLPSIANYMRHFDRYSGERYALEATPSYCYGGIRLLDGIRRTLDHPRIILILREPVARLWSAYTFQRGKGHLRGIDSFEHYVEVCRQKRRTGQKQGPYFGGVTISFYAEYVPEWFRMFGDHVRVIFSDDLFADPEATVRTLCTWLEIDSGVPAWFGYSAHNKTVHARSLTLSRGARAVKGRTDILLRQMPETKRRLKGLYFQLNGGELNERLAPETRRRLEEMYQESNHIVARELLSRGYEQLPEWMQGDGPQSTRA